MATEAKTKEYMRPMPATWWLHNRQLTLFMIRELTCVFVAGYAVFLLVLLYKFGVGKAAFRGLYNALGSPLSMILHLVALVFVVYHSITWLNLTPKVVIVWRGEEKVPAALIVGAHYALWFVVSVMVFLLVI